MHNVYRRFHEKSRGIFGIGLSPSPLRGMPAGNRPGRRINRLTILFRLRFSRPKGAAGTLSAARSVPHELLRRPAGSHRIDPLDRCAGRVAGMERVGSRLPGREEKQGAGRSRAGATCGRCPDAGNRFKAAGVPGGGDRRPALPRRSGFPVPLLRGPLGPAARSAVAGRGPRPGTAREAVLLKKPARSRERGTRFP